MASFQEAKRRLATLDMSAKNPAAATPVVDELVAASANDLTSSKWKSVLDAKGTSHDRSIAGCIKRAKALVSAGRAEEAEQLYLGLLSAYPDAAGASFHLGKIYMRQRRWREAIPPLRAALAVEPTNTKIRTTLARALFKDGEYQKAIIHCRESISTAAQGDCSNWLILGRSLEKMGQKAEAIAALRSAVDLAPTDVGIRAQLIDLLMSTGRRREACAECSNALRCVKSADGRRRIIQTFSSLMCRRWSASNFFSYYFSPVKTVFLHFYLVQAWLATLICCRTGKTSFSTIGKVATELNGGELSTIRTANVLLPISDPMFVNWKKTFFSEIAENADFTLFGIRWFNPRDVLLALTLLFASYLKATGEVGQAGQIYAALSHSKRKRDAAFGHIGLGDIAHLAALWNVQIVDLDERGLTLFPIFGGVTRFFNDQMGWRVPEGGFERANSHYRNAVRLAPDLAFAWYQLARVNADQKRFRHASRFMAICLRVATRCSASVKQMLQIELSRLSALNSLAERNGRALSGIEQLGPGRVRIVEIRADPRVTVEIASKSEALRFHYTLHYKGSETQVVKTGTYPQLRVQLGASGTVSSMMGAPFISERGYVSPGGTNFPHFPGGRETFSPMFLGQAGEAELYIENTAAEFSDVVILPGISQNYFHFLFDALGAALLVDERHVQDKDLLFFCDRMKSYHLDLFEMLGMAEHRVHAISVRGYGSAVSVRNAIVPDYPNQAAVIHPEVARRLRKRLLGSMFEPRKAKRVYLARSGARSFVAADRAELNELLSRHGFVTVDPGSMTVAEQIELMRDAEVIAVEAGAAASNLLFAPAGASAIMISPAPGYYECFTPLCSEFEIRLNVALVPARVRPKYLHTWCNYEPELDIETISHAIEAAVAGL